MARQRFLVGARGEAAAFGWCLARQQRSRVSGARRRQEPDLTGKDAAVFSCSAAAAVFIKPMEKSSAFSAAISNSPTGRPGNSPCRRSHTEPPQGDDEAGDFYADLSTEGFAGGAAFVPLFSVVEHKRWCDLSYEEAKDLAIEAKAFRARPNVASGRFPDYLMFSGSFAFFWRAFAAIISGPSPVPFDIVAR